MVYTLAIYYSNYARHFLCLQALDEQFPREEGYRITRYDPFKFNTEEPTEIYIEIDPHECDQYIIALEPIPAKVYM